MKPATPAEVAHLLRRTSFGPFPGAVARAVDLGLGSDEVIEEQLAKVLPFLPVLPDAGLPSGGVVDIDQTDTDDLRYYRRAKTWWVPRMLDDGAGVHEKLMWLWHGVFTTSESKVDSTNLCWRQLRTLHRLALGNLRDLLHELTVDGAMLRFLDGDRSIASAPNENYGREVMELFTLGLGHFTQDDVTAAARALAGWSVGEDLVVRFEPADAPDRGRTFLGHRQVRTVEQVVDAILDHEACAPHIVERLWSSFIGGEVDQAVVSRWADQFRASDYEIAPLVQTMLLSDELAGARRSRARTPIEWYCAAARAAGPQRDPVGDLQSLGQVPYLPPNVSGWPTGSAWFTTSQTRARAAVATRFDCTSIAEQGAAAGAVDALLDRCSLDELSAPTRAALDQLDRDLAAAPGSVRAGSLLAAITLSPEFALA